MSLPIEYRKKISKHLPLGEKSSIARKLGVRRQHVSAWFNGSTSNLAIEKAVMKSFAKCIKEQEKYKELIDFLDKID